MNDIAIKVDNLSKVYKLYPSNNYRIKEALHPLRKKYHRPFYALKNVSFKVKKGEVLGIVGKNGSGKSTLLKIISGVLRPTEGDILINGEISALLELGSGFNPNFTGIENVFFYGSIMGFSRNEMEDRLQDILSFADIGHFVNQPVKIYSNGMKARLAFAVAIRIDPDILIIDEVLAVGDELFRRKCYAEIEKFMKQGVSILFVSHSISTINLLCSRGLLFDKGELILEGSPKLITTQYQRLLYAKSEDTLKVREEIIEINHDEKVKKKIQEIIQKEEYFQKKKKEKKNETKLGTERSKLIAPKAYYIPQLRPKSTVEYKNYDVDIFDCYIETLDGKKVNNLVMDEEYIYTYKAKFNLDAYDVSFGMQIKSEKGVMISGAALYKLNPIKRVRNGDVYKIYWHFTCKLLKGTYYTNAGVSSVINEERVFLNRIVDAVVFKVQDDTNLMCTGFTHFDLKINFEKISNALQPSAKKEKQIK